MLVRYVLDAPEEQARTWKSLEIATLLAILQFLLIACGCSSKPAKPSAPPLQAAHSTTSSVPSHPRPPKIDLEQAAAKPSLPFEGEGWQPMFDGKTLAGWKQAPFGGGGEVECQFGMLILNMGDPFSGVNWTNDYPKMNYEIAMDAMRLAGSDFFCGLTVPVGDSFCSLIVGGWGGSLLGISSLDGMDASENETTKFIDFQERRWYRLRLRIMEGRIQAWVDQQKMIDADTSDKKISLRPGEIELSKPLGIASYETTAALRQIQMRKLPTKPQ